MYDMISWEVLDPWKYSSCSLDSINLRGCIVDETLAVAQKQRRWFGSHDPCISYLSTLFLEWSFEVLTLQYLRLRWIKGLKIWSWRPEVENDPADDSFGLLGVRTTSNFRPLPLFLCNVCTILLHIHSESYSVNLQRAEVWAARDRSVPWIQWIVVAARWNINDSATSITVIWIMIRR